MPPKKMRPESKKELARDRRAAKQLEYAAFSAKRAVVEAGKVDFIHPQGKLTPTLQRTFGYATVFAARNKKLYMTLFASSFIASIRSRMKTRMD